MEKADGRGPSQVIEGSIRGMSHVDNMYPRYHGLGRALHLCGHPPPSPYPCEKTIGPIPTMGHPT